MSSAYIFAVESYSRLYSNSDDFGLLWRHNAHQLHIFYNVYTSILTSQLCHVPDADMFMTAAQLPLYQALLRALVPGPLLLTDKQNEHDLNIVGALVGHTKTGEASVVKTQQACRPLANRLFPTSTSDQPVGNGEGPPVIGYVSSPRLDSSILVAWNTRDRDHPGKSKVAVTVLDILDALELPATKKTLDESYIVYRHGYTGGLSDSQDRQVAVVTPETYANQSVMTVTLEHNACEAFTIAKMHTLQYEGHELRVACLGLVDKLAGLSALQSVGIFKGKKPFPYYSRARLTAHFRFNHLQSVIRRNLGIPCRLSHTNATPKLAPELCRRRRRQGRDMANFSRRMVTRARGGRPAGVPAASSR